VTLGTTISGITGEGNGVTVVFVYPFQMPAASDAVVTYTSPTGTVTVIPSGDYSISGIGVATGGSVTYPLSGSPIPAGSTLTIQRIVPLIQGTSLSNQGPTFAAIEAALDYEMMAIQQIAGGQLLALTGNIADPAGLIYEAPPVAARALQLMGWDGSGNVIAAQPSSALVSTAMQPVVAASTIPEAFELIGGVGSFLNAKYFGAVGDGVTDDTAAINLMLASALPGQQCWLTAPGQYLINSANVAIPIGVQLCAGWAPPGTTNNSSGGGEPLNLATLNGAIILNPAYTITMASGSAVRGVPIYRKGLAIPAANSAAFAGLAITIQGDDCRLEDVLVLGFANLSTSTNQVRGVYRYVWGDNQNGISVVGAFDVVRIENCHFFPYCTYSATAAATAHYRSGIAFQTNDCAEPSLAQNFCFAYYTGYSLEETGSGGFVDCKADGIYDPGGTGFVIGNGTPTGGATACKFIGCVAFANSSSTTSSGYTIYLEPGDHVEFTGCSVSQCAGGFNVVQGEISINGGSADYCASVVNVNSTSCVVNIGGCFRAANPVGGAAINNTASCQNIFIDPSCDFTQYGAGASISTTLANYQIASGSTIDLPPWGDTYQITGTASIGVVASGWVGRRATLLFTNVNTMTDGSSTNSVRLNSSSSFTSSTGSTLSIVHNGFQWFETGRCA
jgi:hypothetical protein